MKVFDVRPAGHNSFSVLPKLGEGDIDKLQAFYKFQVDTRYGEQRAKVGERYWALYGFELKAGPAILQPQVRKPDGSSSTDENILMFQYFSSAPTFEHAIDPPYFARGVAGFTTNGNIGWAYNNQAHIGENGGPFSVWCSSDPTTWTDRRVGSDCVHKIGYWDDHVTPNPIFIDTRKGGTAPPITTGYRLHNVMGGVVVGYLEFVSGPPPALIDSLVLVENGEERGHLVWKK